MIDLFGEVHPRPFIPNDSTSSEITGIFISELDNYGDILTQADVDLLLNQKNNLFSDIFSGKNDYIGNAFEIYSNAVNRVDSLLKEVLKSGLDFNKTDTIYYFSIDAKPYYSESNEIHFNRIIKRLKYKCFDRVYNSQGFDEMTEAEFNGRLQEVFPKVVRKSIKKIANLKKDKNFVSNALLNSIAQRYDPHSNYFSDKQNKQFSNQLSSQVDSYGFDVSEDKNGNIIIAAIIPGGSAWQSNQISENDVLISITIGDKEYLSYEYDADEIQEKLDEATEKTISLTLKKQNGQINTLQLLRRKTDSQDNAVKGYILKDSIQRIGYIALPSFYTDMNELNSPGSADDVAKEIIKLEKDSINGLIIDLRNNGGGSIQEAINLAGIFVNEGPLFIMKLQHRKPNLVKDMNRGSVFNKPIIVLINEISASASELFCNIVKDYRLGLIVGQTSYGKGTAQIILPLSGGIINEEGAYYSDYVKITEGFFYRLNNSSHQAIGIVPDVMLPETPILKKYSENNQLYYLLPDTVKKIVNFTPNPEKDMKIIRQKSAERINNSLLFKDYEQLTKSINQYFFSPSKLCLTFREFKTYKMKETSMIDSLDMVNKAKDGGIKCINNTFDNKLIDFDEQISEFNKKIIESIQKDIFISEAFHILNDYIKY